MLVLAQKRRVTAVTTLDPYLLCRKCSAGAGWCHNVRRRYNIERNPAVIIKTAIKNCSPVMQLEKVKVGSVTYHVPTPISESR